LDYDSSCFDFETSVAVVGNAAVANQICKNKLSEQSGGFNNLAYRVWWFSYWFGGEI
jgi:hypothetical protein